MLRGAEATAALDLEDTSVADGSGPGFGLFAGVPVGGGILPRMGFGIGFEWLRPPRAQLEPDPGAPFRFTLAWALGLGKNAGIGLSWHHFSDDGSALGGQNTFDAGLSTRLGNYAAFGAGVRDINTGDIGGAPVQRRYRAELVGRPLGTAALEIAIGGQLGETRLDTDGWARAAWRITHGLTLAAEIESRELHVIETSALGPTDTDARDVRGTVGVEVSFGQLGLAAYGTGLRDTTGANHPLGGSFIARASAVGPASILGHPDHIERVELTGELDVREVTHVILRMRDIALRDPDGEGAGRHVRRRVVGLGQLAGAAHRDARWSSAPASRCSRTWYRARRRTISSRPPPTRSTSIPPAACASSGCRGRRCSSAARSICSA